MFQRTLAPFFDFSVWYKGELYNKLLLNRRTVRPTANIL